VITDFEGLEEKFKTISSSKEIDILVDLFNKHENIYVIGNGGLHYIASHMATDVSRLVDGKFCHSFDSFGFITSSANDYGFDSIFERWILNCVDTSKPSLLLGLSCSGSSMNILRAIEAVSKYGWDTFMITGKQTQSKIDQICIDAKYFHTVEAFCLMLFYEIIHRLGAKCPQI